MGQDAARVRVRGWGVEAVVSNFDDILFERLQATEGVSEVRVSPMRLDEIFRAVVGEP